jgi:hypothetical protein
VLYQGTLVDMSQKFIEAKMATDYLLNGTTTFDHDQLLQATNQAITLWNQADTAQKRFQEVTNVLGNYTLASNSDQQLKLNLPKLDILQKVYAADDPFVAEWNKRLIEDPKHQAELASDIVTYNEHQLWTAIDKAPPKDRVQVVADYFNTDIQTATTQLQRLQKKITDEEITAANFRKELSDTYQVISTGAKVVVFVGGITTGAGVVNLVATSIAGAGLVFDCSNTLVDVGIAGKNGYVAAIGKGKDAEFFKAASFITSVSDLAKATTQLNKIYQSALDSEGNVSLTAIKNISENKSLMDEIKSDGSGNMSTIYDWGSSVWDFLTAHPEVKSVDLNPQNGTVVVSGSRTSQLIFTSDPLALKAMGDFVKVIPLVAPTATPSLTIIKACNSGELVSYLDCDSGGKVYHDGFEPGSAKLPISADGKSITVRVSGGKGSYHATVYLSDGTSLEVGTYYGESNQLELTEAARNTGWTMSGYTITMPNE